MLEGERARAAAKVVLRLTRRQRAEQAEPVGGPAASGAAQTAPA